MSHPKRPYGFELKEPCPYFGEVADLLCALSGSSKSYLWNYIAIFIKHVTFTECPKNIRFSKSLLDSWQARSLTRKDNVHKGRPKCQVIVEEKRTLPSESITILHRNLSLYVSCHTVVLFLGSSYKWLWNKVKEFIYSSLWSFLLA